jgi:glutamate decarboxylase
MTGDLGVGERVFDLFGFGTAAESAEAALDRRVQDMMREFLSTPEASTDIGLDRLQGQFPPVPIPGEPCDPERYFDFLSSVVVRHSTRTASPRFIGHMTSALPWFVRPLARLVTAINQNVVKSETAKAMTPLERQTLAMMHRLVFGRPESFYERHQMALDSTLGAVVSGGTVANLTGLWCARNDILGAREAAEAVEQQGLAAALRARGHEGAVVVASSLAHYSIEKSLDVLGLGARSLLKVPVDARGRMDLGEARRAVDDARRNRRLVLALVGVAGTTDTGAVDPLPELADLAERARIHFHVDAAWAGPLLFSAEHRGKLAGIERADSVTLDGHKQLYLPMGIGMVLFRDPRLARRIEKQARYIVRPRSVDLGKRALEGSRPAMALVLHAALQLVGQRGYAALVDNGIRLARHLARAVARRDEFELLGEPEINILAYRYLPERWRAAARSGALSPPANDEVSRFNERLQKAQRQAGRTFVSRTTLLHTAQAPGVPITALRAVTANPLTTEQDLDAVLADQLRIARELAPGEHTSR